MYKFWDTKSESRKSFHMIQTMAPVSTVKWRPGYETQVACCSLSNDFRIQVFDLCSPYVPLNIVEEHENVVSGLLWKSSDILYSCSRDWYFSKSLLSIHGFDPRKNMNEICTSFDLFGDFMISMKNSNGELTREHYDSNQMMNRWDEKVIITCYIYNSLDEFVNFNQKTSSHILHYEYTNI